MQIFYSARHNSDAKRNRRIQLKSLVSMKFSSAVEVVILTCDDDEFEDLLTRLALLQAGEAIFICMSVILKFVF